MTSAAKDCAFVAIVHGTVQGVGFRYYARSHAHRLGVRGYVQNLADGTVKVVCEGRKKPLEAMKKWLQNGPPSARVTRVDVQVCEPTGAYATFTVEF